MPKKLADVTVERRLELLEMRARERQISRRHLAKARTVSMGTQRHSLAFEVTHAV